MTFNKDSWLHGSIDAVSRISQFTIVPTLPSPPYTVSLQTAGQAFHKKNTKKARNYFHNLTCPCCVRYTHNMITAMAAPVTKQSHKGFIQ